MLSLLRRLVLSTAWLALWHPAAAQVAQWHVSAGGAWVQPTLGLADRFDGHLTGYVGAGRTVAGRTAEVRLERLAFAQGEVTLRTVPAGRPVETDQFDLALTLTGASAHIQQAFGAGRVRPAVGAGGGLYHWRERRAAYEDSSRAVPALARPSQASAGLQAGAGVQIGLGRRAILDAGAAYHVVLGDLWPTLSLGLESVSSFQFARTTVGLRVGL